MRSYRLMLVALVLFSMQVFAQSGGRPRLELQPKASLPTEPAAWSLAPLVPAPITRKYQARVVVNWDIREMKAEIAPGVIYDDYWAFQGHVPGPVLRVREGDLVEVHLTNNIESMRNHNIDFHFVSGPGGGASSLNVAPGQTAVLEARAMMAGFYMFHCASPDIPMHIANGMYGFVIVEPAEGLPAVEREYYVVQSELYTVDGKKGHQALSMERGDKGDAQYVVFNGAVGSMIGDKALKANLNETVRIWVGNAGPNYISSFHVIGQIFSNVYREGDLLSPPAHGVQTTLIPAGGSAVVEFQTTVPGTFLMVDHAIFRLHKGAAGSISVGGGKQPEIFDPITAGESAMKMSDKDHLASVPMEGHDHMTMSASATAKAVATPVKRTSPSRTRRSPVQLIALSGPVTGISAASFPGLMNEDRDGPAESTREVTIQMMDGSGNYNAEHTFSKTRVVIKTGTKVTFFNADSMVHFNKDDKGEFATPKMLAGASYSHVFTKPGTYNYQCIPHPWMKGTIIVK
jgi:copper-containing nitrite reductase